MSTKKDTQLAVRRPVVADAQGNVPANWDRATRRYQRLVTVTCSTATCPNFGRYWQTRIDDNADGIDRVLCGLCSEWIEDITDDPAKKGFTRDGYKGKHANQDWDGEIADWDDNDDQQ